MNIIRSIKEHIRLIVQIVFAALSNGYVNGFLQGTIYQGTTKRFCVPGLNCYSCPGALGACPIGALQAVLNTKQYKFSFYVIGILMAIGAFFGRFVCGWLCPFGLVQDLLYKIPIFKKISRLPGEKYLRMLKYVILAVFVIVLPITIVNVAGMGNPWFCKLICPSGTLLGGVPLILTNPVLQNTIGSLFFWKVSILVLILVLSVKLYRPFCRYLCPLGAIYSFFNPISFYHMEVDKEKCTKCKVCQHKCGMDIPVYEKPNAMECIRCGKCIKACPHGAIKGGVFFSENKKNSNIFL